MIHDPQEGPWSVYRHSVCLVQGLESSSETPGRGVVLGSRFVSAGEGGDVGMDGYERRTVLPLKEKTRSLHGLKKDRGSERSRLTVTDRVRWVREDRLNGSLEFRSP